MMLEDRLFKWVVRAFASSSIIVVVLIFLFLLKEALPFLAERGPAALLDARWVPVSFQQERFGLLPLAAGTLLVTSLAIAIALPLGLAGAVYLSEIARPAERELLKPLIELLAGIPSVVLGFFGLLVIAPLVKSIFGLASGLTALTGGIVLAFMAIPTIMTVAEEAIRSVPEVYRHASLALGASSMQTVFGVTVPAAKPGIAAAVMLGIGRAVGETMAVLMVTGNAPVLTLSPLESVRTMTATIAAEMGEVAFGSTHYHALFCVGVVLLAATFLFNLAAHRVLRKAGVRR